MKVCESVQYNDFKGKIFADEEDLITNRVLNQIAEDFNADMDCYYFAIVFIEGNFYLLGTKDKESLQKEIIEKVVKVKIDMDIEKFLTYFKRFNFCLSKNIAYLEKNYILDQ